MDPPEYGHLPAVERREKSAITKSVSFAYSASLVMRYRSITPKTSGNRGRKPESWFLNLMSGQYTPVTRPLSGTIRNELNISPGFVA
jgi:hypothetical protein